MNPPDPGRYPTKDGEGWKEVDSTQPFGALVGPIYYWFNDEDLDSDEWAMAFEVAEQHGTRIGLCHGGMTLAFIDMVSGQAAAEAELGPAITVSLDSDFKRPIKIGDWVTGISQIRYHYADDLYIDCQIYVDNKLMATSSSHWKRIRRRKGHQSKGVDLD